MPPAVKIITDFPTAPPAYDLEEPSAAVIANVTEAIYDTATGRFLLIPQGSRLIGRYDSQVAFGQRRVLLVWTRLILPDNLVDFA